MGSNPATEMTSPESRSEGKALRARVPRKAQAGWRPSPDRRDAVAILEEQAESRVKELVPIRYGRMLASPFAFYRGAAAIMAADLAGTPTSGLQVQLCGDAHLVNFGIFAAPDRRLVFDVNDFDETLRGPWEWDLKRLAASVAVAARDRGFPSSGRVAAARSSASAYRESMWRFAGMRTIDVWYDRLDVQEQSASWAAPPDSGRRRKLDRTVAKARVNDNLRAFEKLTHELDGTPRIVSDPPLIVPLEDLLDAEQARRVQRELLQILQRYRKSLGSDRRHLLDGYRPVHLARKVVGIGSVGTRAWVALLLGHDRNDPLFLQIKEAGRSVLEPFAAPSPFASGGRRVVEGQRLMQAASDTMLGWLHVTTDLDGLPRDYYVRQLWDLKASAPIASLSQRELIAYAALCGSTLARAHARSGDRDAIAAYLGKSDSFEQAIGSFAETYAGQNERDFEALAEAVRNGSVLAETGR
ncbi:MAG: hypothetical protein QOI43_1995 [Gaiellales bacterium]|nr:hypothetical protein [Gaiellales bacterium]